MNRDSDLVLVGACFRLDGKGDGRLGKLRRRIINGRSLIAECFAGSGLLQFGDSADVSGVKLSDLSELLALNDLDVLETFRKVAVVIDQRGVVFQHAAFHLEIVDAPRKWICQRFENKKRQRLTVVVFALNAVAFAAGILE